MHGFLLFSGQTDLNERRISSSLHLPYHEPGAETASLSQADYVLSLLEMAKAAKGMGNNNTVITVTFTIGVGYHIQFLPAQP